MADSDSFLLSWLKRLTWNHAIVTSQSHLYNEAHSIRGSYKMTGQLYTPWRMAYIKGEKVRVEGCIFCNKIWADDAVEHIVARSTHVYVVLNRFPYNNGHVMVIPYEHVTSQEHLEPEALVDLMLTINRTLAVLRKAYNPNGFNLGANIGAAAGAGIEAHYHFHIVPRWNGDSNFMGVVGETRIIPDTLDNTYQDLKTIWQDLYPSNDQ